MNVSGDTVIGGNLTLGDADTDSISFGGEISSSLIPDADIAYDVGSSSKRWRYGHIQQLSVTHITASGNISSSGTVTLPTTLRFEGGSGGVRYSFNNLTQTQNMGTGHMLGFHIASGSDVGGAIVNMSGSEGNVFVGIGTKYTAKMSHALTVEGDISASGALMGVTHVTASGNISGSSTSTGSFGALRAVGQALTVNNVGTVSGSATSTGSFGALRAVGQALTINNVGTVSGSATSTGSFGYMNVSGDTVIGGNLTLGDADTDSVSFGAEISSSIVPDADSSYDIGSSSKNWKYGYIEELSVTNVTASGDISGSSTSTGSFGNMSVGGTIAHDGDSDTKITFTDDDINITVGNMNMIDFTEDTVSEITINESGADLDFRVESDDDTKAIYVNAGQNSIQLGSAATTHVTASGNISGSSISTGSFGRIDTVGDIYSSGRIYEAGSSVIDHATAMAIVFGG